MRKIYIKTIIIVSTLLLMSCENWLDVEPKTTIKGSSFLKTEQGFKDALMGCYIKLTNGEVYGQNLSFGAIDAMAQQYELSTSSSLYRYANFEEKDSQVETMSNAIWKTHYNVIANLNNLIDKIDVNKNALHPTSYNIIKGEAIGLRAFLYFDLIRLFGPGNLAEDKSTIGDECIPYVKTYNHNIVKFTKLDIIIKDLKKELKIAADILNNHDPYGENINRETYDEHNDDKFYSERNHRFNYHAVLATLARIHLWLGEYDESLEISEYIMEKGKYKFQWIYKHEVDVSREQYMNHCFHSEHILGLEVNKLGESVKSYTDYYSSIDVENANLIYWSKERVNEMFELEDEYHTGQGDYRYFYILNKKDPKKMISKKYLYEPGFSHKVYIPLIKMPEMYLIAAECAVRGTNVDINKSLKILNTFRKKRGIKIKLPESSSKEDILNEVEKEYRKEFLMEGQMFFYYKRLNKTTIKYAKKEFSKDKYIFKIPTDEINLNPKK